MKMKKKTAFCGRNEQLKIQAMKVCINFIVVKNCNVIIDEVRQKILKQF